MTRVFWMMGCGSALLAVAAGAFGAHGLRSRLTPEMLLVFETAARYQMYHSLALLGAAWAAARWPESAAVSAAGWLFVGGIFFFSGSLYMLALTGVRWLGAITPVGGVAFLLGWTLLAWAGMRGAA